MECWLRGILHSLNSPVDVAVTSPQKFTSASPLSVFVDIGALSHAKSAQAHSSDALNLPHFRSCLSSSASLEYTRTYASLLATATNPRYSLCWTQLCAEVVRVHFSPASLKISPDFSSCWTSAFPAPLGDALIEKHLKIPSEAPVSNMFLVPGFGCQESDVILLEWSSYHLHKRPLTDDQTRMRYAPRPPFP